MRRISIIVTVIVIHISGFAQENKFKPEHMIGIKAGGNIHYINNDFLLSNTDSEGNYILSSANIYGISTGIVYKNFLEKNAGTFIGLFYTQKGGFSEFLFDENEETLDTTFILFRHDMEYIEMPIMMNIRIGKGYSRLNFYLGPSISYLYKQKITFLEETFGRSYQKGTNYKFEFAINFGGAYAFSYNKGEIELNFMYSHGLTNIFKQQSINNSLYNQTQVITASLFYYYKI